MTSGLTVRLLGQPALEFDGAPWHLALPPRYWTLLALLSLGPRGAVHKRSAIAAALWPEDLKEEARAQLRRHLHRLTHALPPCGDTPWLNLANQCAGWNDAAPVWIDVVAFSEAAANPQRYSEAVDYYRGDLLEGSYDECLFAHRERLRATYLDMCRGAALSARLSRKAC